MARRPRPPKHRYSLICTHNGARLEFVGKTAPELVQELRRLQGAIVEARLLARFIKRLRHPAARAFITHMELLEVAPGHSDMESAVEEACRINLGILTGLDMLNMMSNSKIDSLENLRFHMTYASTHKKRDFQQGWNGTAREKIDRDDTQNLED